MGWFSSTPEGNDKKSRVYVNKARSTGKRRKKKKYVKRAWLFARESDNIRQGKREKW